MASILAFRKAATVTACAAVLGMVSPMASAALTINTINTTVGIATTLTAAVQASGSGINVVSGSEAYQGTNTATFQQSGTYSGFNLAPSSGSTATLTTADGIFLTSGNANIPLTNTSNSFSGGPGSGTNALLDTLTGSSVNDANALTFDFTVASGINAVTAKFIFGTDEFPTQSVTDIFGFFVDGVNYAQFPSGELISNTPGNPTNFILNPVGSGLYGIEYNGLTKEFTITAALNVSLSTHTISIAIADTSDTIYDSGVFVNSLAATTTTGCTGIGCNNNNVPEPGSLALVALGMMGLYRARRRA
ncbi:MAG: PEP-CTERM sorting domain-containing protein [Dechloromonas sp.]|nr:PEP-CTERM sorting domain-containing protein [Dechloromonas sp.]